MKIAYSKNIEGLSSSNKLKIIHCKYKYIKSKFTFLFVIYNI